jgi:two-component system, sensor histidine kinase and response regulator
LCTVSRDVTERKRFEEALKESEGRFRQLFERSTDALFVHDERGRFVDCNAEACRALGYERDELLALSVADVATHLLSEEERCKRKDDTLWKRATRSEPGKIVGFEENELRRKDGTTLPVEVGVGSIEYEGRRMIFASVRDLTERKRAEETLKESEERYRAVVELSAESIWLFDPDTKQVLESNTTFQEMLGYTAEELRTMTNYDFVAHNREDIDAAVQRLVQERRGFFGERKYRRKDGTVLDVEVSGTVIPYRGGEVVCGVARDLTERKRAEERLREAEERYRTVVEEQSELVCRFLPDLTITFVNDAYCRYFGVEPGEVIGKSFIGRVAVEDRVHYEELSTWLNEGNPGGRSNTGFSHPMARCGGSSGQTRPSSTGRATPSSTSPSGGMSPSAGHSKSVWSTRYCTTPSPTSRIADCSWIVSSRPSGGSGGGRISGLRCCSWTSTGSRPSTIL